jgi:Flp pilus assembly protein TadD
MANARLLAGKPQLALESLDRAAELSPDDPTILADLGALLSRQGHHERAVPALEKAGALGASSPYLLYALAQSQIAMGRQEAAQLTILKLQLLYPDSPQAREFDGLR